MVALFVSANAAFSDITAQYLFLTSEGHSPAAKVDPSFSSLISVSDIAATTGTLTTGGGVDGANMLGAYVSSGQYYFGMEFTVTPSSPSSKITLTEFSILDMLPTPAEVTTGVSHYQLQIFEQGNSTPLYTNTPYELFPGLTPDLGWGTTYAEYSAFYDAGRKETITGIQDITSELTIKFDLWNRGTDNGFEELTTTTGVGSSQGIILSGTVIPEPAALTLIAVVGGATLMIRRQFS